MRETEKDSFWVDPYVCEIERGRERGRVFVCERERKMMCSGLDPEP